MYREGDVHLGRPVAVGSEQVAVGDTAISLSPPPTAEYALIAVQTNKVRWLVGEDPEAGRGLPQEAGSYLEWLNPGLNYTDLLRTIRFIKAAAGADAVLDVQYLG